MVVAVVVAVVVVVVGRFDWMYDIITSLGA